MLLNKSNHCFNCKEPFEKDENYCPHCGQKNTDMNISFWELMKEFAGDYFTFDSKLFRTMIPLTFRPGKVPKEFIDGKRVSHIPPLRILIFLSFICFFLWGLSLDSGDEGGDQNEVALADSAAIANVQTPSQFIDSINNLDTPMNLQINAGDDTLQINSMQGDFDFIMDKNNDPRIVADSVLGDSAGVLRTLFIQGLRMYHAEEGTVRNYLMSNISWVILLMQPFFALLLKLVYVRRKEFFYIEHLVFSLYYHGFILLATIASFFLYFYVDLENIILGLSFLSFLYLFFAIKNFYMQSWGKSFLKSTIISIIYLNIMFPFFLLSYFLLSLYFY